MDSDKKHNLLILPKGNKAFQDEIERSTPNKTRRKKNFVERGSQVTKEAKKEEGLCPKGWGVPKNFCPDCGKNDIRHELVQREIEPGQWAWVNDGATNVTFWDEPRPDLDIAVGDCAVSFLCAACAKADLHSEQLLDHAGRPLSHLRREKNLEDWIRAAKMRGEQPTRTN